MNYKINSIKTLILGSINELIKEKNLFQPFSLNSSHLSKEHAALQFDNTLRELEINISLGIQIIKKEMENLSHYDKEIALASLKKISLLLEAWEFDASIKINRPSNQMISPIYQIGRKCLLKKNIQEAKQIFIILIILRPDLEINWIGFALAEQCLEHFAEATSIYEHILSMNPDHIFAKRILEELINHHGEIK